MSMGLTQDEILSGRASEETNKRIDLKLRVEAIEKRLGLILGPPMCQHGIIRGLCKKCDIYQ